ncbi:helix-turn-helix transcriptional regulator [Acidobacteria bacterium AB60]|nr:helix-turn-helix transcriptional regulator [Acidobacteria bacterium AB60]
MPGEVSSRDMEKYLATPSLRISRGPDWQYLTVRTRLEPASCRYLRIPATPDPWLVLTTGGGPRKTEVRGRNGWSCAVSGPGSLALTSPGKSTEIRWDHGDGSGIETIHVCIDAALFHRFASENIECDPARVEIIDGFAQRDPLMAPIVSSLGAELINPDSASRLFLDSAAQMLVAQLLRKYCAFPFTSPNRQARLSSRRLRTVEDYVQAGLASSLTLEDIAASIHMSAYHFARTFKATTGETPHAYVTRLRVERAQELLRTSTWSMSAIARRVGFSSKSHFAAVFLRYTGISPHRFRGATRCDGNDEEM